MSSINSVHEAGRRRAQAELPKLAVSAGEIEPAQRRVFKVPAPRLRTVVWRALVWLTAAFLVELRNIPDRLTLRYNHAAAAHRLAIVLRMMRGSAVMVAQQVARRIDLLPFEFCYALSSVKVQSKPMDIDYVAARVEAAVKGSLVDVFARFDPDPVASNIATCVYHAQLKDGRQVAVRVRRDTILAELNAERVALTWLARLLLPFLPRRYRVLEHLLARLPQVLMENLDFVRLARLQQLLRRRARKGRLTFATAAKVHLHLSSDDVIISDFIDDGVSVHDIIAARENNDEAALAKLAAMDIDPDVCGRRLLHVGWWSIFENLFVLEDAVPSGIMVRPGNELVFLSLRDTGVLGWRNRRILKTAMRRLTEHDVEAAVALLLQLMAPLPHVDLHHLAKRTEAAIFPYVFAMENPGSVPRDRSSEGMWRALLAVFFQHGVVVRLDIARTLQGLVSFDQVAMGLSPRLRILKEFRRYEQTSYERLAHVARRELAATLGDEGREYLAQQRRGVDQAIERAAIWSESLVENSPVSFMAMSRKSAYAAVEVLDSSLLWGLAVAALSVVKTGSQVWYELPVDVVGSLTWAVTHPVSYGAAIVLFIGAARRIMFRLRDIDNR